MGFQIFTDMSIVLWTYRVKCMPQTTILSDWIIIYSNVMWLSGEFNFVVFLFPAFNHREKYVKNNTILIYTENH